MTSIRRGPWWTLPFLYLGKTRNILVPHIGQNVPFVIKNYPYRDPYGRETVTFVREYRIRRRPSRFDATMINDNGGLVDYLGTHQHLAVDLDLQVTSDGSLLLTTRAQRFYEGRVGFRFPLLFSGQATLHESYDDDAEVYRVALEVRNPVFGFLFGYEGHFQCEFLPATDAPPISNPSVTSAAPEDLTDYRRAPRGLRAQSAPKPRTRKSGLVSQSYTAIAA